MIAIVDYGVGNIRAFINIYRQLDIPIKIARVPEDLTDAQKLILPGVGAFDYAIERLIQSGMREQLDFMVLNKKIPVLGVCVGMQMLAHSSEEGSLRGLGWIDGVVKKFDINAIRQITHLPHMGWNNVRPIRNNDLFKGLELDARFYFLHSYYFHCNRNEDSIAVSEYGYEFTCAVNSGNVYGIQCHPEKSHSFGIQLLKNFATL